MNQESAPLLFDARRLLVYVEDLDRAVDYYRDVLGFKPLGGVAGTNFEFATSGAPLVLHRDGQATNSRRGRVGFVPSFQVRAGIRQPSIRVLIAERQESFITPTCARGCAPPL